MNSRSEEKILCPYCGEEMQFSGLVGWMHSPPAGAGYNWHQCGECPICGASAPEGYGRTLEEAKEAARAAALRRYTPPLKPMTLEEVDEHVRSNDANPLWIEDKTGYPSDEWILAATVWQMCKIMINRDEYGKTWRCWERRPTDEERRAAEWKN